MLSPIPNAELLHEVLALIEADPDHFDPARFISKDPDGVVRFDLAGRTIAHRYPNALWRWKPDFQRPGWQLATAVDPRDTRRPAGRSVYYLAMRLLNIGFDTAKQLFADDTTIAELRILVHQLTTAHPQEGDHARP
jgi:hypothetical protein